MRKEHKYLLLIVILLAIGVGYAFLNAELHINGTAIIKDAKWNIHFENYRMTSNSRVTPNVEPVITGNTTTEISYDISFEEPGDVYEFLVDIKNGGTLMASISSLENSFMIDDNELSTIPNYFNYSVTYSNGDEYVTPHNLSFGDKETILVRVEFKRDISATDLLEVVGKRLRFGLSIIAVQGDDGDPLPGGGRYVYTITPSLDYIIGEEMPSEAVVYSNYQALNAKAFLRHKIENGVITETAVGFIYEGNVYFLPMAISEEDFLATLDIMCSIFGNENCDDRSCFNVYAYSGNGIIVADDDFSCKVGYHESYCYNH